jgi:hypothetical protein
MDKHEWQQVEQALSGTYGHVVLLAGGEEITLERGLVSKDRLGIVTWINGEFQVKWCSGRQSYPEQQFLRRRESLAYTGKMRAALLRMSKRQRQEIGYDVNKKYVTYPPLWTSFSALRRHYQQNFPDAKLVEVVG